MSIITIGSSKDSDGRVGSPTPGVLQSIREASERVVGASLMTTDDRIRGVRITRWLIVGRGVVMLGTYDGGDEDRGRDDDAEDTEDEVVSDDHRQLEPSSRGSEEERGRLV